MRCLLCSADIVQELSFHQLFTLAQPETLICSDCVSSFEKIAELHCPLCYKIGDSQTCQDCLYWQKQGKTIEHRALYHYNDAMKAYFSRYKFQGDYLLRKVFATEMTSALKSYHGYTLVPIPLGPKREAERGFNQVTGFLEAAGLAYQELLVKADSQKQSEKTRDERLKSENYFTLRFSKDLPDKILIIDDIYTTGATLRLVAQLFHEKGVKKIKTFSLAR